MATDLSQDAVLSFVQNNGGSVKNSDLLLHFRSFIRDHADRDRNRTLFKKFVNSVATVRQDDGVSYIVLKKQFRGYVPRGGGGGSSGPPRVPAGKITEPSPQSTNQIPAVSAEKARLKPLPREGGAPAPAPAPAPPGDTARTTILPAAGLMVNNNNNVETTVNLKQLNSTAEPSDRRAAAPVFSQLPELKTPSLPESPVQDERTKEGQQRGLGPLPGITPVVPTVRHHRETNQLLPQSQILKGREAHLQSEGGLHQEPPLHHEVPPQRIRHRPSYKSAVSCDEEEEELPVRRSPGGAVWPVSAPPRDTGRPVLFSSPRIIHGPTVISSSSSESKPPKIFIQDIEGESLVSRSPGWSSESGLEVRGQQTGTGLNHGSSSGESASTRRSLPLEAESYAPSPDPSPLHADHQDRRHSQTAGVQLEPAQGLHQKQRAQLSSSHSSVFSSSSDAGFSSSDWPPSGSSRGSGWNSSFEDLQAKTGKTGHVAHIQDVLQRAQETKLESVTTASPWHHMSGNLRDDQESADHKLHLSTGDLLDNREEVESSDCSASTPVLRQHLALPRRLSREVRSRMCRSLGTDLDQIHQEGGGGGGGGNETARLNRLHLISSSLSLRANLSTSSLSSCSTPPRCQSLAELHEETELKGGVRSLPAAAATSSATRHEGHVGHSRQSLVPLEPREHAWFVKGAAGAWPDIYSLFREDPSLLNKQDFISGFTVLHWIVKHGDHRVLNTLWYGVEKAGLTLNINTRSTCGHTPLHIAAMHGRSNMIRLLVKKFYADVKQRDIAGKRPWQYLSCTMMPEIFQLLGAPARAAVGEVGRLDQQQRQQQQQQQRRRRHHLSSAFGERPLTTAGASKVKRSTSLAAFLKHKPLLPFHGQQSDI